MTHDLIRYFIVDAFTDRPFGGNPAAVVMLSEWPDDSWLQNIAVEMNLSETAFLVQTQAGFDLRWFTPTVEVDLCGHATLASAFAIRHAGLHRDKLTLKFSTRSGLLSATTTSATTTSATTTSATTKGDTIQLDFPLKPELPTTPPADLLEGLSVTPIYVGKSEYDYVVEVETEHELRSLTPNFAQLAKLDCRGIIVTSESTDPDYDFASRFFGPAVGVDEDPVTGSAHCCLANYWQKRTGRSEFTAFQASQRGGVIHLTVQEDRVLLAGNAVIMAQGELLIR